PTRDPIVANGTPTVVLTGTGLRAFRLADVTGDGIADLVAIETGPPAKLDVEPGNGAGFGAAVKLSIDASPLDLAIGDLDGDGTAEIVVVYATGFQAFRQTAPGTLAALGPQTPLA